MKNLKKISFITTMVLLFSSCGEGNKSKVYHKQRAPSDIKISSLDLQKNEIQMRFEYRTYVKKTLTDINCDLTFNESEVIHVSQQPNIKLDSFSTEILTFNNLQFQSKLSHKKSIDYSLDCQLQYDKGEENVVEHSVLHLVPGTKLRYR